MAIKDPNVLNRFNTLNTNLEKANIAEIEKDISGKLFNVLGGADSISVDTELYASINNVANSSDIDNFITKKNTELPNTSIKIEYHTIPGFADYDIKNTVATLANPLDPAKGISDTESKIVEMKKLLAGLNNLPNQIDTLKKRLQENHEILNKAHDVQDDFDTSGYGPRRKTKDIQKDINTCNNLKSYLAIIDDAEKRLAKKADPYYEARRDDAIIKFNAERGGIADEYIDYATSFGTVSVQVNNKQKDYNQEKVLIEELEKIENSSTKTLLTVPSDLGLFNSNDTIVTTPFVSLANIDTERDNTLKRIDQLDILRGQIENIRDRYQENIDKLTKILALQNLKKKIDTNYSGEMLKNKNDFKAIRDVCSNNLSLGKIGYEPYLPDQSVGVGKNLGPIPLNFLVGGKTGNYSLCDKNGNPLKNNGGALELQLEGGKIINIKGITFDNVAQTMTINGLKITPVEGIDFPLKLNLNVRVGVDAAGIKVYHHKPICLEIVRPTLLSANREDAYDSLVPPMKERIKSEYTDKYRENLENEAIWKILREGGNEAQVNEIYNNETRRKMFIDRIRSSLAGSIPFLSLAALQVGFKNDMIKEDRDVPMQYLLGKPEFQNYLRQNISDNLKNYASKKIEEILNNPVNTHRDNILKKFLEFQTDIINNRKDNKDNINILNSIPPERPEGHPNTFFQRLRGIDSIQNNYTKFFQGRHSELKDLSLETEDGTIKYGVKVEVTGVNKLTATINIDGKDEPEIIDAPNHDELIAGILNMTSTKDGERINKKLLCNIALSVLKAMVLMSPQKLSRDIQYLNPIDRTFYDEKGNPVICDRMEAFVKGGNLIIRGAEIDGSRTRHNVVIFDEAKFKNLYDENMLEDGIHTISTQINSIMNATAQEYHEATSAMLRNDGNRYVMRYNTAQWLRGGPIKRLRGRIIHGKTSNDFDFDNISVNEAGKSVNIKLNKGKFIVTGDFEDQHYEYKGRNLGSILRKKINRKRVFDGVELAMLAAINEEFVTKLRKNHWVQTENFIISDINDGKTGKTYIYDNAGNLSYLEIEDIDLNPLGAGESGRVDPNQIPTARKRCNEQERREFMQNPLLAGRLQREMRRRLSLF